MKMQSITYFDDKQKLIGELIGEFSTTEKKPAIILFPAFEGRGEFAINYAKKLAGQGYIVFVADMYGDAKIADTLEGCFELITPFLNDRELVRTRAVLAYQTLLQQPGIDPTRIGAVGFCFGGMCLLELARSGADLKVGVSLHGVLAKSTLITHPIKTKLLILQGYQDPQIPPDTLAQFAKEMTEAHRCDWTFTFFGEAKHSFTDPKTGSFDPIKEKEMGREYNPIIAMNSLRYTLDFFAHDLTPII